MSSDAAKLHPAAIAVLALDALREAALPIVVLLFAAVAGSGLDVAALQRGLLYLAIGVAGASLMGLLRWLSTTYSVDDGGVHSRTGFVRRKETTVPLSRVQGLDTVAGPVQRAFGVVAVPELRWSRWRYEVRDAEIDLRHGTLRITRTLVPMLRVQHVDTTRGPLDQLLGLATVVVHTAAGTTTIPALEIAEAGQLRDRIAALARTADEL